MSAPALVCPRCGAPLGGVPDEGVSQVECAAGHVLPVVAGILDCRPELPGFDTEADRSRALELASLVGATFESLLRHYWRSIPDVPEHLVERFVRGDLIGAERAADVVGQIGEEIGDHDAGMTVLEVGSGTAALGSAFSPRSAWVVASDMSLAWLVLARARLRALGLGNVTLVAATADRLPFPEQTFDLVVAADVIEHVPDPEAMVRSCVRALRPGGSLWLSTPNRYSLTPEPHVRLWGVGLLPRPLAVRYVRRLRGVDYSDVRTMSAAGLRRVLEASGTDVRVDPAPITAAVRGTYGAVGRRAIDLYHLLLRLPLLRRGLQVVAPLFHATARRRVDAT